MGAIGVEVLGPRERPNEKPGVLTARRSPLRAMPRCPAQPVSMSPDSETLSSRVEDRCHGGSVSTVVTAGKRYIRSRLRALKIGGSRERTPVRLRAKRNYDATQGSSMRPGQNNKRMRGRPNNRKGPNPLTRSYESSGPDVKIRGTAHHIGEKYLQLARDAQTSGDPVMAESYLQHAEHYFRLIAAAQQVPQQGPGAYQGQPGEANVEEAEDDSDFAGIPDRFASPAERFAPPQPSHMPQPQPSPAQPGPARSFHHNEDRQGFTRPERAPRPERSFQDRNYRDREYQASP